MSPDAEIKSYAMRRAAPGGCARRGRFHLRRRHRAGVLDHGTDSGECCAFSGGPFVESRFFGEGIGIAVRKGNDLLRQSLTGRCSGSGKKALHRSVARFFHQPV